MTEPPTALGCGLRVQRGGDRAARGGRGGGDGKRKSGPRGAPLGPGGAARLRRPRGPPELGGGARRPRAAERAALSRGRAALGGINRVPPGPAPVMSRDLLTVAGPGPPRRPAGSAVALASRAGRQRDPTAARRRGGGRPGRQRRRRPPAAGAWLRDAGNKAGRSGKPGAAGRGGGAAETAASRDASGEGRGGQIESDLRPEWRPGARDSQSRNLRARSQRRR